MNTDVQKTHRIVVSAGVGLIALVGASVLAVSVRHTVPTRITATPGPIAALPDTSVPPARSTPETAPPPPAAVSPPLTDAGASAAASASAPSSAPTQPPATAAPRVATKVPSLAATHPRVEPADGLPAASNTLKDKGEETAMASTPAAKPATEANGTRAESAATGSGMLVGANADTAPGAADSQSPAAGASASVAGSEPALSGGEVSTTMQARAAGGDSANSDRLITSAVQSQIATDAAGAAVQVNTINGVVILTGTVPTADAVEHVKQVAQQVKDVKGVDATAVRVSGS